jgi:hypothetical protein
MIFPHHLPHYVLDPNHLPPVMQGGVVVGVLSAIWNVVLNIAIKIYEVGKIVFQDIASAVTWAAKGVAFTVNRIAEGLKSAAGWVEHAAKYIWGDIKKIYDEYQKFRAKLTRWLSPVFKVFQTIRTQYQRYWNHFVKPILNGITRARQMLGLLKFFHVGFAAKLDSELQGVYNDITHNTLLVQKALTDIAGYFAWVTDPLGRIAKEPLIAGFLNGLNGLSLGLTGRSLYQNLLSRGTLGGPNPLALEPKVWGGYGSQALQGLGPIADAQKKAKAAATIPALSGPP